jgi:hypothetical protein
MIKIPVKIATSAEKDRIIATLVLPFRTDSGAHLSNAAKALYLETIGR